MNKLSLYAVTSNLSSANHPKKQPNIQNIFSRSERKLSKIIFVMCQFLFLTCSIRRQCPLSQILSYMIVSIVSQSRSFISYCLYFFPQLIHWKYVAIFMSNMQLIVGYTLPICCCVIITSSTFFFTLHSSLGTSLHFVFIDRSRVSIDCHQVSFNKFSLN